MFKPKTFVEVCRAMQMGVEVEIRGETGIIQRIEREDGSGRNFNITLGKSVSSGDYGRSQIEWVEKSMFFSE